MLFNIFAVNSPLYMSKEVKRYLVTSALPYANGPKHIGHLAGAYLPADIYVRYLRAQKREVAFVCGSDEHGAAITIQAMKEKTTPKEIVDKYHAMLQSNMADLSISFDIYHRTSSQLHKETAQEFFTMLNENGDLEQKETEQYYDEEAQTFLADRYIAGTCPVCGNANAYGDQCESCGTSLSPDQLIEPHSTLSGNKPIRKATTHWYLPLNKHEDFLREWILKEHKNDWKANVLGQCKSWLDMGLQPRAVTRDLDWGVPVPVAPPAPQGGSEGPPAPQGGSKNSNVEEGTDKFGTSQNPPLGGGGTVGASVIYNYNTADPFLYSLLKDFVKEHRSTPTQAENALWQILRGKKLEGVKFRRQHIIGSYIADFISLEHKLIIEVDGLIHQLPENKESDKVRTEWLEEKGFKVIRFTNDEVLFNTDKVLEAIKRMATPPPQGGSKNSNVEEGTDKFGASPIPPLGGGGAAGAKVLYVWFDAPIGYISATKQWAADNNKDWKPYWYADDTKMVNFIGKDNIVFHAIIFPVMLKLHGNILPDNVPANEFMNLEGDKMSTSRGWSIEMEDYINDFVKAENGGGQMVDALRYYLTAIAPETKDSEFTWKGFQDAVNSELVAVFGNFVNRTFVLMHKLCKGKVPVFHNDLIDDLDKQLLQDIHDKKNIIEKLLEQYKFRDAQAEVVDLARKGNKYMQDKEPWIVAKRLAEPGEDADKAQVLIDNCLHLCLQLTANLAILIRPFLPNTAAKMCHMMKVVDKMLDWENAGTSKLLSVGYSLRPPELLFRKIEDTEVSAQVEKLKTKKMEVNKNAAIADQNLEAKVQEEKPAKPEINFDDFSKIELKVGTITAAEKVEKADKLLKLEVDLGEERRTIVSGIAMHFDAAEIVGKQVSVVTNLAPRKMRGIESNGMILMAEDASGKLHFLNPDSAIDNGSSIS